MNTAPTTPQSAAVTFTAQEASVLLELLDVSVKTLGLKGAEAGVVLSKKIQAAFESAKEVPAPEAQA